MCADPASSNRVNVRESFHRTNRHNTSIGTRTAMSTPQIVVDAPPDDAAHHNAELEQHLSEGHISPVRVCRALPLSRNSRFYLLRLFSVFFFFFFFFLTFCDFCVGVGGARSSAGGNAATIAELTATQDDFDDEALDALLQQPETTTKELRGWCGAGARAARPARLTRAVWGVTGICE